ncbi:hypothetical protein EVAR_96265_1 [Eumeta japonica]|uniref:Uncharacterized protein n=1 Tax=Eumeta variegata TaxID=151549 RepID=A0A4C1WNM9_EUMVA|nr:hypothetical protein EVAR_96265_1 [Eumeta japonica]
MREREEEEDVAEGAEVERKQKYTNTFYVHVGEAEGGKLACYTMERNPHFLTGECSVAFSATFNPDSKVSRRCTGPLKHGSGGNNKIRCATVGTCAAWPGPIITVPVEIRLSSDSSSDEYADSAMTPRRLTGRYTSAAVGLLRPVLDESDIRPGGTWIVSLSAKLKRSCIRMVKALQYEGGVELPYTGYMWLRCKQCDDTTAKKLAPSTRSGRHVRCANTESALDGGGKKFDNKLRSGVAKPRGRCVGGRRAPPRCDLRKGCPLMNDIADVYL